MCVLLTILSCMVVCPALHDCRPTSYGTDQSYSIPVERLKRKNALKASGCKTKNSTQFSSSIFFCFLLLNIQIKPVKVHFERQQNFLLIFLSQSQQIKVLRNPKKSLGAKTVKPINVISRIIQQFCRSRNGKNIFDLQKINEILRFKSECLPERW